MLPEQLGVGFRAANKAIFLAPRIVFGVSRVQASGVNAVD